MEKVNGSSAERRIPFGFCDFDRISGHLLPCRAAARLPQNSRTVIMFAFPYKVFDMPPENISRYAAVPDYHTVCENRLETVAEGLRKAYPENEFEVFTDNSPIPEVYAAACVGLGVIGQNGLLITKEYGSFVFLGEIVTDLAIKSARIQPKECLKCGKCMDACPVNLCKGECFSALTQKKGGLSDRESEKLRKLGSVWGCDVCQNVCPLNKSAGNTDIHEFKDGYRNRYTLDENPADRAYNWRGPNVIKRNYKILNGGE